MCFSSLLSEGTLWSGMPTVLYLGLSFDFFFKQTFCVCCWTVSEYVLSVHHYTLISHLPSFFLHVQGRFKTKNGPGVTFQIILAYSLPMV